MEEQSLVSMPPIWVLLTLTILALLWIYGNNPLNVIRATGVTVLPGGKPFIGHILQMMKVEHMGICDLENMKKYGKLYGVCEFHSPVLVITDQELLQEVLIKQFNSFTDRRKFMLRKWFINSLIDKRGSEWKRVRSMLTPFFSTGKLKHNVPLMYDGIKSLSNNLRSICRNKSQLDTLSVSGALALDIICATAFGLKVDSQNDSSDPFLVVLKQIQNIKVTTPLLFTVLTLPFLEPLFEFFGISMFPSGYLEFFEKVIKELIADRQKDNHKYQDFIQAMVKAHMEEADYNTRQALGTLKDEDTKRGLTEEEIMAQCLLFFLAGYDTTSKTLSLFMYSMATHPEIQEKVHEEIERVLGKDEANYENIGKLEYLDMCLSETLRIYPPGFRFDRQATEDVTIGNLKIAKDTIVVAPLWAIHHDPELWPDPETFDPERFTAAAKASHLPFSFMPFGAGLRNCIGMRFAQIVLKLAAIAMIREFKLVKNQFTKVPLEFENAMFLQPKGSVIIGIEERVK